MPACPICKSAAERSATNEHAPFCSKRCKLVDLGAWIDERYRVSDETVGMYVEGDTESEGTS